MNKFDNFVNKFAEVTAMGFGLGKSLDKDSDDYIDYLG